jgi:hypothetical protein
MAILLLCSAYLQLNDPDAWLWVGIYGLGGVMMLMSLKYRLPVWVSLVFASACLSFALWIMLAVELVQWPAVVASLRMAGTGVEEVREVAGLAIQGAWFGFYAWYAARTDRSNAGG